MDKKKLVLGAALLGMFSASVALESGFNVAHAEGTAADGDKAKCGKDMQKGKDMHKGKGAKDMSKAGDAHE